jgi:hypothetical protein
LKCIKKIREMESIWKKVFVKRGFVLFSITTYFQFTTCRFKAQTTPLFIHFSKIQFRLIITNYKIKLTIEKIKGKIKDRLKSKIKVK